jgi:hypothetical protein
MGCFIRASVGTMATAATGAEASQDCRFSSCSMTPRMMTFPLLAERRLVLEAALVREQVGVVAEDLRPEIARHCTTVVEDASAQAFSCRATDAGRAVPRMA